MRNILFNISLLAVAVFTFSVFCGCERQKVWRIGVSQCSSDDWRNKMNEELMREAMFFDDMAVEIRSADDSNEKQIADIKYFIENKFDAIMVAPNEAEAITPIIHEAYYSGIPVVVFDRSTTDTVYTAFRGADNHAIGRVAAEIAYQWLGDKIKVLELTGLMGSKPAYDRGAGFHEAMSEFGLENRIISAPGLWNYNDAYKSADSIFADNREINLVFAHNDRMAMAARDAADKYSLGHIKIIGVDAAPEIGIQAVVDSVIDATIFYPTQGGNLLLTTRAILQGDHFVKDSLYFSAAPVDINSAEILLRQNEVLIDEADKLENLKGMVDEFWNRHSAQTTLLYVTIAALILLAGIIFMLLRTYWAHVRHRAALEVKNRQLEESAREIQSLYDQYQEAMQSKLTFFTNVSHDLRTPLSLIAEPVNNLYHADNLSPQQHTLMRLADKNVKILHRLINQILDFRKFEHGKLFLNLSEVDLRKEISDWVESFRVAAARRHIRFELDFPKTTDARMALDIERFERVFFNLISNAFKFTPPNGRISVAFTIDTDNMIMRVADTGKGMTPENAAHIFERFYQVEKIDPNGSGIGLAVSKVFVELHGGSIDVDSCEGKGTVFTVTIPRRHVDKTVAESVEAAAAVAIADSGELEIVEPAESEIDTRATSVLVIDDNEDMRTMLKTLLGDTYTVILASSGMQGIRLATKYIPDLIICDIMMPGIDGLETCNRLKQEPITSHIPVLMLTACSMDEQRVEGYQCGADAYISKPFDSRVLLARCEALLLNRKRIRDSFAADAPVSIPVVGQVASAPLAASSVDDEFFHRFIEVVKKEMSDSDLSVEDLADRLGLSRVQFYRKIKALTNYSPAELVRIMRLKRAEKMLKTTSQTVSEVTYAVGFSSPSYFSKCYKDYFGESPTDVQRRTSQAR